MIHMKRRDMTLIGLLVLLALGLLLTGIMKREHPAIEEESEEEYSEEVVSKVDDYFRKLPAESYLLITTTNNIYSPIPLTEENALRLRQEDGSENIVHIGKNSFYMESSNCDNQNCVQEGEVNLNNIDNRALYNMVVCLPHKVTLELLTPEEARKELLRLYSDEEAYRKGIEEYLASYEEEP